MDIGEETTEIFSINRRRLLEILATSSTVGLTGCTELMQDTQNIEPGIIGSGREGRGLPGGTPMESMPSLSGELTVYSGRGEFLVGDLMQYIRDLYPDFTLDVRYGGATDMANQIRTEGSSTPADVFFTVNVGILGLLGNEGLLQPIPEETLNIGREEYRNPNGEWIGTSGRVRTVPYNTTMLSSDDIPNDIMEFPNINEFQNQIGWAPTYGSFQGFITVMRILNGEDDTIEWLEGMLDLGVQEYPDEFRVVRAIANGEISLGLTNHYYILRLLDSRPDAPLDMTFTQNDAGSFFNLAGAGIIQYTENYETASNFIRHLLSAEAQDYFARSATFEYPMIPEIDPIDRLPSFEELNPPDLDFTEFARSDINKTIDIMEQAGVL